MLDFYHSLVSNGVTVHFTLPALNVIQVVCCSWKYFHAILHTPDTLIKVLFATFLKMRTFQFYSRCRLNDQHRVKISILIQTPGWLVFEFLSQMKIPNLRDNLCQGWGDLWMLPFRTKRVRCLASLVHNGSGVFGVKQLFLVSMNCVKVFTSTFEAMSIQGLNWLQKLWSCIASFGAKVVW